MSSRFAHDRWSSREYTFAKTGLLSYDKVQHFLGGIVGTILFGLVIFLTRGSILISIYLGGVASMIFWLLWEVKDAIIAWEDRQYMTHIVIDYNWGGDGFSWKDMVSAWAGAGLTVALTILIVNVEL